MENLISANEFCINHKIEISFISSLQEYGLIEVTTIQDTFYIDPEQLQKLESFLRMHYEMDINMEGIEAIAHLLQRTQSMQEEILKLKNRLRLYEDEQI
ncbi:MAG: chaperone modulator CbpM [Bacteroidia bacterium]